MTAACDGPPAAGFNRSYRPTDGYQSEAEPARGASPRGRGGQRGRGGRGRRGGGGGDMGRYCETDVEELSPGRAGRRSGREPFRGSVENAIRPLEAPAQSVITRLAPHTSAPPPRPGSSLLGTPPKVPLPAPFTQNRSPPAATPFTQARTPPATAVQARSPPPIVPAPMRTPPAHAVRVKSPPAAAGLSPAAATSAAVYAVTLEPGKTYQVGPTVLAVGRRWIP